MRVDGRSAVIFRVASIPSISGITMSIRITSGSRAAAFSTASTPFSASPTTCMSFSVAMSTLIPFLTMR